ncbi:MAG: ABC transporter ATP-binding protein [Pseudomonadota bacterium]
MSDTQGQRVSPGTPVVSVQGLDLTLGEGSRRVHILRGLNLTVSGGTSLAIVGPSGSGKSSLLMVLSGLERPTKGTVSVAGTELGALAEDDLTAYRGREIGIVFQSFHLIPTMTALENVAVPLELAGIDDAFGKAAEELTRVGLGERLNHYPKQMSGGEQQRVAIARALAPEPALVLADEPTGNLDETTGDAVAETLFAATAARGKTLILITHDIDLARKCDMVKVMRDGRLVDHVAPSQTNAVAAE